MIFGKYLRVSKSCLFYIQNKTVRQIGSMSLSQTYKSVNNNSELFLKAWPCGHLFWRVMGVWRLPLWNSCMVMLLPSCSYCSKLWFPSYIVPAWTTLKHHNKKYCVTFYTTLGYLWERDQIQLALLWGFYNHSCLLGFFFPTDKSSLLQRHLAWAGTWHISYYYVRYYYFSLGRKLVCAPKIQYILVF